MKRDDIKLKKKNKIAKTSMKQRKKSKWNSMNIRMLLYIPIETKISPLDLANLPPNDHLAHNEVCQTINYYFNKHIFDWNMNVFQLILSYNIKSDINYHKVNIEIKLLKVRKTNNKTIESFWILQCKYIIIIYFWSLTKQILQMHFNIDLRK